MLQMPSLQITPVSLQISTLCIKIMLTVTSKPKSSEPYLIVRFSESRNIIGVNVASKVLGENDTVTKKRKGNPKRKEDVGDVRGCLECNIKVDPRELLRVWIVHYTRK